MFLKVLGYLPINGRVKVDSGSSDIIVPNNLFDLFIGALNRPGVHRFSNLKASIVAQHLREKEKGLRTRIGFFGPNLDLSTEPLKATCFSWQIHPDLQGRDFE